MKKGLILGMMFFVLISQLVLVKTQNSSSNVNTNLEVPYDNFAPSFSGTIPNQTWAKNTNRINSINLMNYFSDNNTLSFSHSSLENITVNISETTVNGVYGVYVSFFPDSGFTGIRNITFTASDGVLSTGSNVVFLNVTEDTIPPEWSNPTKDENQIYQNMYVNFFTTWTDNIELDHYTFSIRQNGAWFNSADYELEGTSSVSDYQMQISGSPGSTVQWYFTGYDTSGNSNTTTIQNFTVLSQNIPNNNSSQSNGSSSNPRYTAPKTVKSQLQEVRTFRIDPSTSFKINMKQGQTSTISLKITNTGNQNLTFNINIAGLEGFETSVSENNFEIAAGKSKTIIIEIKAGRFLNPDIYNGEIIVSTPSERVRIPVVVELNKLSTKYGLSLILDEDSKKVKPSESIFANVTLSNLEDIEEKHVDMYYAIRDYAGNILNFKEENFTFNKKVENRNITLEVGKDSLVGEYIIYARAIIGNETILASDTFEIGERFNLAIFIKANIFLIILLIIIITIVVFIIKYRRDKERLRLLNLYVMIKEMKSLLDEGKLNESIEIYIKIKRAYGEKISESTLNNKEELKKEMEKFTSKTQPLNSIIQNVDKKNENLKVESKPEVKIEAKEEKKEIKPEEKVEKKVEESKPEVKVEENKQTESNKLDTKKETEQSVTNEDENVKVKNEIENKKTTVQKKRVNKKVKKEKNNKVDK